MVAGRSGAPSSDELDLIAGQLLAAQDGATLIEPFSDSRPNFDVAQAYGVLRRIVTTRERQGWEQVGRKIGFTNHTIWEIFGVSQSMWAPMWRHSTQFVPKGVAEVSLDGLAQPRIEPEVVFGLRAPVTVGDALTVLASVEWMAAGFEIVQCPYPRWRFTAPDCTAAYGLHGAMVVGDRVLVTDANRDAIARALPAITVTLSRAGEEVDRGLGSNVLGSPALSLAHLAEILAGQPTSPPLEAGEIVTTGTITNAWPVVPGETWQSSYDGIGLAGLRVTFS